MASFTIPNWVLLDISSHLWVVMILSIGFLATRVFRKAKAQQLPLAPSPPGDPIIGHLRHFQTIKPELWYQQLSTTLASPIISLSIPGTRLVVCNTHDTAVDLLERRGANYSDRPPLPLFQEMGFEKALTLMSQGPEFRLHRKALQKAFLKSTMPAYHPIQVSESKMLLREMALNPEGWALHIKKYATAIIIGIGFGIKIKDSSSPYLKIVQNVERLLSNSGSPGATLVDFVPFVRHLPSFFHDNALKWAHQYRKHVQELRDKPFAEVKALDPSGRMPSLITSLLEQRQEQIKKGETPDMAEDDIKGAASIVFTAGQDTTSATLLVFILAAVRYPKVMAKARQELDDIVGRDRLPTFNDFDSLPYLECVVQETLRWISVAPVGVPHVNATEDVYMGYRIPKGTLVVGNIYAMLKDPTVYRDPDEFEPERYIPKSQGGRGEPFPNVAFGFGRRVCPGRYLAHGNLRIAIASMLSTLDIQRKRDTEGNEIIPDVELSSGLSIRPIGVECVVKVRDKQALDLIMLETAHMQSY